MGVTDARLSLRPHAATRLPQVFAEDVCRSPATAGDPLLLLLLLRRTSESLATHGRTRRAWRKRMREASKFQQHRRLPVVVPPPIFLYPSPHFFDDEATKEAGKKWLPRPLSSLYSPDPPLPNNHVASPPSTLLLREENHPSPSPSPTPPLPPPRTPRLRLRKSHRSPRSSSSSSA